MKQHILVISQYFYPEEFRINDICKELVKLGYEITVVTGIPNYPIGKFFKGYGWLKRNKEMYEGIHIIRLPIVPRGNSVVMLAINYLSFVVSGFVWKTFTKIKADKVFIFEVSPMTQALVGVWYALKNKLPCMIYVQDLWPENVEFVTGIHNKKVLGLIDKMVNYIYKNCHKILATSPSFVKRIEERESAWNGNASKVIYWPQYAESFYCPVDKISLEDMPQNNKFKIVFTGNIGYAQGLDILPRTAELLKRDNIDCEFIIIGDGRYRNEFIKTIIKYDVKEMFYLLGQKKPKEIPNYLAGCDMAFVSFADNPLFSMTIPAKLQSYMACGMPILAVADGETKRIIEEAECGICIPNREPNDILQCIKHINEEQLKIWKERSYIYYKTHFDSEVLLSQIDKQIMAVSKEKI